MQILALKTQSKKRAAAQRHGSHLCNRLGKSSTATADLPSPPLQMELIWPGKQRVKIPANVIETTSSKKMIVTS